MSTTIKTDPVCGMVLEPETASATFSYAGWTYLFCCRECLEIFKKAPDDCVVYLAHSQSGCLGYVCEQQRTGWRPTNKEAFR
jgi:YHS domain-containing protein